MAIIRSLIIVAAALRYSLNPCSSNAKTGKMAVSRTSPDSCPFACPLRDGGGCYGETGPCSWHWPEVATNGLTFAQFVDELHKLPDGSPFRHDEVGDLPGDGHSLDRDLCESLTAAVSHLRAFTYTHYPVLGNDAHSERNRHVLYDMIAGGFTINVSVDRFSDVDRFTHLEMPLAVVVPEDWKDGPRTRRTPNGTMCVLCPAAPTGSKVQCVSCMLCAKPNHPPIMLPAHGARRRKVSAAAL